MRVCVFWIVTMVLFTFAVKEVGGVSINDYCKIDSSNTPCATYCSRSKSCGKTKDGFQTFTDAERERALKKHNELRQAVAKGDYADHKVPASNGGIFAFSYDKEVEFVAACHIKACQFKHDKVRMSADGYKMGQNLHMFMVKSEFGFNGSFIEDGIQSWFNEYHNLQNSDAFNKYSPTSSGSKYGHLTALLWGLTKFVGCAKMHTYQKKLNNYMLFCNYMPSGNIIGAPVYKDGACTPGNEKYQKLCGEIRPLSEDDFVPPLSLDKACAKRPYLLEAYLVWYLIVDSL